MTKTAILHTLSGNKVPVEVEQKIEWMAKAELGKQVKQAFNDAGMIDRVVWAEIM